MSRTIRTIHKGHTKSIAVIVEGNKSECLDYIESREPHTRRKLKAIMSVMADLVRIQNEEIFKHLEGKIYEFKARGARIYCFFDGTTIVCTHGADKTKRKRTKVEIERAIKIMNEYFAK